jgi:hypothetical protein
MHSNGDSGDLQIEVLGINGDWKMGTVGIDWLMQFRSRPDEVHEPRTLQATVRHEAETGPIELIVLQ